MQLNDWLDAVRAEDELGLLKEKPHSTAPTADEHLRSKFKEINDFITDNGREPAADMSNAPEFMLNQRLQAIRNDDEQCGQLQGDDVHDLLPEPMVIESLDDIFLGDDLGLLDTGENDIFNLRHVSKERKDAEQIARRKRCEDFDAYADRLKQVQKEIVDGKRLMRMFTDKGEALVAGQYYVMHGLLLYLESIDISSEEKTVEGKRFRKDGRTRCIFENGTESTMLYRSLAKELYKGGKIVSESNEALNEEFYKNFQGVEDGDKETGYIYILQSLSSDPDIASISNLYKIGYATNSVEQRIANAENEPTYLMASVYHVSSYQCFNMNIQKFESLLHSFFGMACLDIEISDGKGGVFKPREWFVAPFATIEMAIGLLISGDIVNYKYDVTSGKAIKK